MLASLDDRSYQRCVLRDANRIMEDVLQPMAFPWQHRVASVRNIPCDIDEMPEVLTAENGSHAPFRNGPLGFGRFDVGQLRRGASTARLANSHHMVCSAARRSDDPGVIEFSAMTFPPICPGDLCSDFENKEREINRELDQLPHINSAMQTLDVDGSATRGELSVRCFEQVQNNKRRKVEQSRACKHAQHVSVKVNSSSSRSSLFTSMPIDGSRCDPKERGPLLLAATLPSEVQNGRFLSTTRAASIAEKLGTYNCRHGLGQTNPSGKNSNRISVGRTRLVWTEKSPSDQPQRVFFTSLLTGDRIEGGGQKRPREIRVGVKVNDHLLKEESKAKQIPDSQGRSLSKTDDDIDEAFDSTFGGSYTVDCRLQCALNSDQLLRNLSRATKQANVKNFHDANDPSLALRHEPPRIECVPDSNGLLSVLCSKPGTIALTGSIHDFLNDAAQGGPSICSVCWSTTSIDLVHVCQTCGVSVHLGCCSDSGEKGSVNSNEKKKTEASRWTCAVCYKFGDRTRGQESNPRNRTSKRESRLPSRLKDSHIEALGPRRTESTSVIDRRGMKCALCPYSGGAMSSFKQDGETIWIHEICRIWSGEVSASKSSCNFDLVDAPASQACALCGKDGTGCILEDDRRSPVSGKRIGAWTLNQTRTCGALVKCAAARCQVKFHPMCAIIVSKFRDESVDLESGHSIKTGVVEGNGDLTTPLVADDSVDYAALMEDSQFCKEYSLTALNCLSIEGRMGKDPGDKCFNLLPVAFCGIHNPKREPSLYGMYPGGSNLDSKSMRIPPLNYAEQ
jgi:hypothetical protein